MLRDLEPSEQLLQWRSWLENYWTNRNQGTPKSISNEEFNVMLHWLPNFGGIYAEAVEKLIASAPSATLQGYSPFQVLSRKGLVEDHPNATAELLISLLKARYNKFYFSEIERDLLIPLKGKKVEIEPEILATLNEALILAGFPTL